MKRSNTPVYSKESTDFKHNITPDHCYGSNERCVEFKSPNMRLVSGDPDHRNHRACMALRYDPASTGSDHPSTSASSATEAGYARAHGGFIVVPDHFEDMWHCYECGADNPDWHTECPVCGKART